MFNSLFSKRSLYMTDGGMETFLTFHRGIGLNHFASFELLLSEDGRAELIDYYKPFMEMAAANNVGFILETPTWRANPDWGYRLGYTASELKAINRSAVAFLREISENIDDLPLIICGDIGPRGDGYQPGKRMSAREAYAYHSEQIGIFAMSDADMVCALTLSYAEEAIGIVQAARTHQIPVAISFTLETDGRLPDGNTLQQAILKVDQETDSYAMYFMVNCAHTTHFSHLFSSNEPWVSRIRGIRANASSKSHEELDNSEVLDAGDPDQLALDYKALRITHPEITIVGGCCGTDCSHLSKIIGSLA